MFVGERCFEGTRTFAIQGIDKAILNLFRMYSHMVPLEVGFESSGAKDPLSYADICGFATLSDNQLAVLIYHHDDWDSTGNVEISLDVNNLPFQNDLLITHYRIDSEHSNAYPEWVRQGKPMYPTQEQRAEILAHSRLETLDQPQKLTMSQGKISLKFWLPLHGVSLVIVSSGQNKERHAL